MKLYATGTRIGQYEVVKGPAEDRKLMGGMGLVYLCIDRGNNDRPVALKTFQPHFLPHRAARERFLREGSAWVQLGRHPHIVHAYEVKRFDHGQSVFLVLEQVAAPPQKEGVSLRAWLRGGQPLPLPTALLFGLQIARGMAHAVEILPGFVHRDLKPENVLVGSDRLPGWEVNRLRVTDFGLATALAEIDTDSLPDAASLTESGAMRHTQLTRGWVGTPGYMAPEQWQGQTAGAATDIYAVGLILVEMLVGQSAVSGKDIADLAQAHQEGKLRPLPDRIPTGVAMLLQRCLSVDPADRYATWVELVEALAAGFKAETGAAVPAEVAAAEMNRAERVSLGWAHNNLGLSYKDIGKLQAAVGLFEQVVAVGKAEEEPALNAAGLGNLGETYRQQGDARRAIGYFEQHLAIAREMRDRVGEGAALGNLGNAYAQLGNTQRAIGYLEQALVITRETGDRVGEGNAWGNLGNAYRHLGDMQQAIRCDEMKLAIAQETGDMVGEGNSLGNLGLTYAQLGDLRRAIAYFEQNLAIARKTGDLVREGVVLGNLGMAYDRSGNLPRAIEYYRQNLAIAQETRDRVGEVQALCNLGIAYGQRMETWPAASYLERALAIAREMGDRVGEGKALGNLGNLYLQLGEIQRAINLFEQSLVLKLETGDAFGAAVTQLNMAQLYAQMEEQARALPLAQAAAQQFARVGQQAYAQRAQQLVAQLSSASPPGERSPAEQILANFDNFITAATVAALGHEQAKAQVESVFDDLTTKGWQLADPIRRIWQGERDEQRLVSNIDANSALIIRAILEKLKEAEQ